MRPWKTLTALFLLLTPALAQGEEARTDAIDGYFAATEASAEKPWKVEGSLGLTYKDGNTDLINFAVRALVEKRWARDLLRFTLQSVYSEEESVETASEHILVQRYEHYLGEKHRIWQQLWLETDSQESLSLRTILTAGYGYRFVKTETFVLWGEVGGGWEGQSFYGGEDKSEGVLQLSVEWVWQITKTLTYEQAIVFWPNLSDSGEFKFLWDSKFKMPISERWSFVLIVQDKYDSAPVAGNENNDFMILFTLSFDFTKKEKAE